MVIQNADSRVDDPPRLVGELVAIYAAAETPAAYQACDRHDPSARACRIVSPDFSTEDITCGDLRPDAEKFTAALDRLRMRRGDRVATPMGKSRAYGAQRGLFFTKDRRVALGARLDCAMFVHMMIVARAYGPETWPRRSWRGSVPSCIGSRKFLTRTYCRREGRSAWKANLPRETRSSVRGGQPKNLRLGTRAYRAASSEADYDPQSRERGRLDAGVGSYNINRGIHYDNSGR